MKFANVGILFYPGVCIYLVPTFNTSKKVCFACLFWFSSKLLLEKLKNLHIAPFYHWGSFFSNHPVHRAVVRMGATGAKAPVNFGKEA